MRKVLRQKVRVYPPYDYEFRWRPVNVYEAEFLAHDQIVNPRRLSAHVYIDDDSFGAADFNFGQEVAPAVYLDLPDSFGDALAAGPVYLTEALFDDPPDAFGGASLAVGPVFLTPSVFSDTPDTFGTTDVDATVDYSSFLVLDVPFDGADGATAATDNEGHALTFVGNAQLDTAAKHTGTASLLLDGSGDYLTTPDSDDWHLPGEFTIEMWIRPVASGGVLSHGQSSPNWDWEISFNRGATAWFRYDLYPNGTTTGAINFLDNGSNLDANAFMHFAISRDASNVVRMYYNGNYRSKATAAGGINTTGTLRIGIGIAGLDMQGWIDDLRIYKGVALYTTEASFRPPDAVNNDYLVLNVAFDGADAATSATDTKGHALTFAGNAQLDTAQKKYGTASLLCDGTGDYVSTPVDGAWHFPGEFTIQAWVRPDWSTSATKYFISHGVSGVGNNNFQFGYIWTNATTKRFRFLFYADGQSVNATIVEPAAGSDIDQSVFHHVAVARDSSNVLRLFLDGVLQDSATVSGGFAATGSLYVGAGESALSPWQGWIDDVQIYKGIALYDTDASFTPP